MAYQKELTAGAEIARKAGDLALEIREGNLGVESKSDESPVTIADRECEKLIVAELQRAFPEDGLLGEEGATRESSNGRKWIIDPIDGTRDFIRGTGVWSVLIGLEEHGKVTAGFAYFPSTGEMFSAARGEGAFRDGQRVQASDIRKKSEALLCCNGLGSCTAIPLRRTCSTGSRNSGPYEAWAAVSTPCWSPPAAPTHGWKRRRSPGISRP